MLSFTPHPLFQLYKLPISEIINKVSYRLFDFLDLPDFDIYLKLAYHRLFPFNLGLQMMYA